MTNKRKTTELHPYSVARWNGQPFHPDYVEAGVLVRPNGSTDLFQPTIDLL